MTGRLEHRLRNETSIQNMLKNLPGCVTNYYNTFSIGRESKTCENYIRKLREFFAYLQAQKLQLEDVTESVVVQYLKTKSIKTMPDGTITETSASHQRGIHAALNSFFEYLVSQKILTQNPIQHVARVKNTDEVHRVWLTIEDFEKILEAINTGVGNARAVGRQKKWRTRDRAILLLFMFTGMRETALTEINVDDIDFDEKVLTIVDKRKKTHTFAITDSLMNVIIDWLLDRDSFIGKHNETDALFISNRCTRLSEDAVVDIVKKYTHAALGYGVSPHKLRASVCRILYQKTRDVKFVRDFIGHRNIATTTMYIGDDSEVKERGAQMLDFLE